MNAHLLGCGAGIPENKLKVSAVFLASAVDSKLLEWVEERPNLLTFLWNPVQRTGGRVWYSNSPGNAGSSGCDYNHPPGRRRMF